MEGAHMKTAFILSLLALPALAGCAATTPGGPAVPSDQANRCQAAPGQSFVGQRASAETGSALLRATNATEIRWVAPDTAVTMDLKFGRLTVSYDYQMIITSVACT